MDFIRTIDGADPSQQNQTIIGSELDDLISVVSTGGLGTISGWDIQALGGNDEVNLDGSPVGTSVDAGDGNDIFNVGNVLRNAAISQSDFFGGTGNDTFNIIAGLGTTNSLFRGGQGADEFFLGGNFSQVTVRGALGDDTLEFTRNSTFQNSSASFGKGNDVVSDEGFRVNFSASTVIGGLNSDEIDLSSSFAGLGTQGLLIYGDDVAGLPEDSASPNNDFILGTATGENTVYAGSGEDFVRTFADNDVIFGQEGNDVVFSGSGKDQIFGALGEDALFGEAGSDTIRGGADDDYIEGGLGADLAFGGTENDRIYGRTQNGDGLQSLTGPADGPNTLIGGQGDDFVEGGNQIVDESGDLIFGGDALGSTFAGAGALEDSGNDTLIGLLGDDAIFGESGNDQIFGDERLAFTFITAESTVTYGDDSAGGDDFLQGDSGNDEIWGGAGNDQLNGGTGRDLLIGGTGADIMEGGSGNDRFFQYNTHSVGAFDINLTTNYTVTFEGIGPDIITDFEATDGLGNVKDQIGFQAQEVGGFNSFENNLNSADGTWAAGDVVAFTGTYNEVSQTFSTSVANANGGGNDVWVFVGFDGPDANLEDEIGTQSVILLGAADESFVAGNFIESLAYSVTEL